MTPLRISILGAITSVLLLLVTLELIRRRRLREKYAILWLATGVVLLALSVWRDGLDTIAGWAGVSYAPAVLFAVGALFVLVVLLHYSTVISKLADQNTAPSSEGRTARAAPHRRVQRDARRRDQDDRRRREAGADWLSASTSGLSGKYEWSLREVRNLPGCKRFASRCPRSATYLQVCDLPASERCAVFARPSDPGLPGETYPGLPGETTRLRPSPAGARGTTRQSARDRRGTASPQ